MIKLWGWLGAAVFWGLWPLWYVYSRHSGRRSRVLVVANEEVLLIKNWISVGEFSLPGGGTKRGETTLMSAVRELEEEVGIITPESSLVRIGASTKTKRGIKVRADFFCVELPAKPTIKKQVLEIQEARWVPLDVALQYRLGDDTKFALKRYKPAEQASLL